MYMIDFTWSSRYSFNNFQYGSTYKTYYANTFYYGVPYCQNNPPQTRPEFINHVNGLGYGGSTVAFGNDCSAFVSMAWKLPSRWTTWSFHNDANGPKNYVYSLGAYGSGPWVSLLGGDAFNHQTSHIILFNSYSPSGGINSLEQTPNNAQGRYWSWSSLSSYQPIRRNRIVASPPPVPPFTQESFKTILHETNSNWQFCVKGWNNDWIVDLIGIKKSGTASNRVEVHILDGKSKYTQFLEHIVTPISPVSDESFEFRIADWNGDRIQDLLAIKKYATLLNRTEVHILDGASKFQNFLLQASTVLHATNHQWEFHPGDFNRDGKLDLIAIRKAGGDSGKTEVHVLNGADNFQSFLLQIPSALHMTDWRWSFEVTDINNDGQVDVVGFAKSGTGSQKTEIHALNGATHFTSFVCQLPTRLHMTGSDFELFAHLDWNFDGHKDMVAVKKFNTESKFTEFHVFNLK